MYSRFFISLLIFIIVCIPFIVIGFPVTAVMLLTKWDGRTTPFGNAKWGKGDLNPAYLKSGYWAAFVWLAYRNPVNNLLSRPMAVKITETRRLKGNAIIGDKIAGGFYSIRMGWKWEYYWIKPYTVFSARRCIRLRFGWKLWQAPWGSKAPYVFAFNPWKLYLGV